MQSSSPVAVITGASSGIGTACARHLSADGFNVALIGRRADALEELAGQLSLGATVHACDLSDLDATEAMASDIISFYGTIDVLVNSAGTRPDRVLLSMPPRAAIALFNQQMSENLGTAVNATFTLGHVLRRPGGRVINIGSIAASNGGSRPGSVGYAAAKSALHGLTLGLARELAGEGVTVNTIAPGFVEDTPFSSAWDADTINRLVSGIPMGRAATVDDISAAVSYLASAQAGMVTAQCLPINGGALPGR